MCCFSSVELKWRPAEAGKGSSWGCSTGQSCVLNSKLEMSTSKSSLDVAQDNASGMTTLGFLSCLSFNAKIQGSFLLVLYSISKKPQQIDENITYPREMHYISYLEGFSLEIYCLSWKRNQCLLGLNKKAQFLECIQAFCLRHYGGTLYFMPYPSA